MILLQVLLFLGFSWLTVVEVHAFVMGIALGLLIALVYAEGYLKKALASAAFVVGFVLGAFVTGPTIGLAWAGFWHPWYILFPVLVVTFLIGEYFDND